MKRCIWYSLPFWEGCPEAPPKERKEKELVFVVLFVLFWLDEVVGASVWWEPASVTAGMA